MGDEFINEKILGYVNLAGPMAGSPNAVPSIISGNAGLPVPMSESARVLRTWPSTYFLMPNPEAIYDATMKDMPAMFTPLGPFSWNNTYDIVQNISGIDEVTLIDDNFSANGNALYETFSGQSLLGSVGAPA